jgi:membrane protease YdiL (CAAX protease family)
VLNPADFPELPLAKLHAAMPSVFSRLSNYAPVKALLPIPVVVLVMPLVYLLFRKTWVELNREAREFQKTAPDFDPRPMVALVLLALTLTIQEYYGGRAFYADVISPIMRELEESGHPGLMANKYAELYGFGFWVFARVLGYAIVPLVLWRLFFPKDSVLDMGLRTKGFVSHLWIYGLCLVAVLIAMAAVSTQSEFLNYYPFYKNASRSWFDLLMWEAMYFVQFFALEFYFRGFLLSVLRPMLGATAIFVVAVPYCMIHYGKPYLEAHGAIVAGIALGSLAMKTRSVYAGFLVHITVAGLMDSVALLSRSGFPKTFWPG